MPLLHYKHHQGFPSHQLRRIRRLPVSGKKRLQLFKKLISTRSKEFVVLPWRHDKTGREGIRYLTHVSSIARETPAKKWKLHYNSELNSIDSRPLFQHHPKYTGKYSWNIQRFAFSTALEDMIEFRAVFTADRRILHETKVLCKAGSRQILMELWLHYVACECALACLIFPFFAIYSCTVDKRLVSVPTPWCANKPHLHVNPLASGEKFSSLDREFPSSIERVFRH